MDDLGFDRLVKGLAASSGRRQAVLASLGGLFAGAVTSRNEADGKGKGKKKKRRRKNNAPPVGPPATSAAVTATIATTDASMHGADWGMYSHKSMLWRRLRRCNLPRALGRHMQGAIPWTALLRAGK